MPGLTRFEAAAILGIVPGAAYQYRKQYGLTLRHEHGRSFDLDEVEALSLRLWKPGKQEHTYWCTTPQAAQILGLKPKSVWLAAREERLPFEQHQSSGWLVYRRHQIEVIANARESRRWR